MYSTDNGAEKFTWPDGGQSPFRGEKNTNWEGGYRVPDAIRWPGVIKPGTVLNDIFAHEDMLPTLLAAAGAPDVKEQLLKGMKVGDKTFKVHLDGYNITDALAGKVAQPAAMSSSTSTTTAHWWRCVTTSGRSSSRSNARTAWTSGRIRSCRCASRSSSTCAPIRSRPPTTRAWITPLAGRARLSAGASAAIRRAVPRHVQGIPAEPEARQLLARPTSMESLQIRRPGPQTDRSAMRRLAAPPRAGASKNRGSRRSGRIVQ